MFGDGSAAGRAAAALLSAAALGTRAERPVDVVAAVASGVVLDAADGGLRELTVPPDEVATPLRAEWAVAFFAVDELLAVEDAELLSELLEEALAEPDPAPVSA
jgi:hypothetical protein